MSHGFFQTISRRAFLDLCRGFGPVAEQEAELDRAAGLVLARDLIAAEDLPLVDRSCMDGYAVVAEDTFGAGESEPALLARVGEVRVHARPDFSIAPGQCAWIPTGGTLPAGADAVVMVEHTDDVGGGMIEIRRPAAPRQHVMLHGEDAAGGDVALAAGTRLRPAQIGLLAALGAARVRVHGAPRTAILSTGDEVTDIEAGAEPGKVRDVNAHALAALVREAGGDPERLGIVPDDTGALVHALGRAARQSDLVLVSGGSSVGTRDHTMAALDELGAEVLAHGVNIAPGKPTILARLDGVPILGLPGQVASAQVAFFVLGAPLLRHLAGDAAAFVPPAARVRAELSRNLASKPGREDFVRVTLEQREGEVPLARPVLGKSGLLRTLVQARGLLPIPAHAEGMYAGTVADVFIL